MSDGVIFGVSLGVVVGVIVGVAYLWVFSLELALPSRSLLGHNPQMTGNR